jgi:hypothetical protein
MDKPRLSDDSAKEQDDAQDADSIAKEVRGHASAPIHINDDDLRAMYVGQRGNQTARRFVRFWSTLFA